MQPATEGAAPVIRLRMDRFETRARELELPNDAACARYLGVDKATMSRIRAGKIRPGEEFIAACLSSGFAPSFEALFELGEASLMICRTLADIEAAAAADAAQEPVRGQEWADRIVLILAPHLARTPRDTAA